VGSPQHQTLPQLLREYAAGRMKEATNGYGFFPPLFEWVFFVFPPLKKHFFLFICF